MYVGCYFPVKMTVEELKDYRPWHGVDREFVESKVEYTGQWLSSSDIGDC